MKAWLGRLKELTKSNNDIEYESQPIVYVDNMGREKFWEDLGRPE